MRSIFLLLCGLSFSACLTRKSSVPSENLPKESTQSAALESSLLLVSFEMNDLDAIVAAFQRNVKACNAFDKKEASNYLFSSLNARNIPYAIVPNSKASLGLVDEGVKELLQEDYNKYRIVFFSPESIFPTLDDGDPRVLVHSEKLGWVYSQTLQSFTVGEQSGVQVEERFAMLERSFEVFNNLDPERAKDWALVYNPDIQKLGYEKHEQILASEIEKAKAAGKKISRHSHPKTSSCLHVYCEYSRK